MLIGRQREREILDRLLATVRAGHSATLVLRGEPGIGKSALLDYAVEASPDLRIVRALGVESEIELSFAALHQLCAPLLDLRERLPEPQREALATLFGLGASATPDRLLVGVAVLGLLSEAASERPLLCLVDDAHWLDGASTRALGFVARRLLAEPVAMVIATREPRADFRGLPELVVEGLRDVDARELLRSLYSAPLDERVRQRLVAETRGNPLALLELPWGLSPMELAGGFGLPALLPVPQSLSECFARRVEGLPEEARLLLLVAASDSTGDPSLVCRAARRLGITAEAVADVERAGLLEIGARARFRHPLVRSAVYRAATVADRRRAHRALAEVTDPPARPRSPGLAPGASDGGPRRGGRGGARAVGRASSGARWSRRGGRLPRARGRADARPGPPGAAPAARRPGRASRRRDRRGDAAARHRPGRTARRARARSGRAASRPHGVRVEARQRRPAPAAGRREAAGAPGSRSGPGDLSRGTLRRGVRRPPGARRRGGRGGASRAGGASASGAGSHRARPAPGGHGDALHRGVRGRRADHPAGAAGVHHRGLHRGRAPLDVVRGNGGRRSLGRRGVGVPGHPSPDVRLRERCARRARARPVSAHHGAHRRRRAAGGRGPGGRAREAAEALGAQGSHPYGEVVLAAWRGREPEVSKLTEAITRDVPARGEGIGLTVTQWASAVLLNGLGRCEDALAAAIRASEGPEGTAFVTWSLAELIVAASRCGRADLAMEALERFSAMARASGTDWALGMEAGLRALLCEGHTAERLHLEAIDRLSRTRVRVELARARLRYGEWLRRERRRLDAREQLRTAHDTLRAMGLEAFAQRAESELLATGERVRRRLPGIPDLTSQEAQVARLACEGLSNPEIGARLFISPRTAEYHLRKVFTKLGISSRTQLGRVLCKDAAATVAV